MSIADKRKQKGMTQKDISNKIGITRAAYANIENGKRNPSYHMAKRISNELGVTIDELITEKTSTK